MERYLAIKDLYGVKAMCCFVMIPNYGDDGYYHQITSFEAFRQRELNNWYEKAYLTNKVDTWPMRWSFMRWLDVVQQHQLIIQSIIESSEQQRKLSIWSVCGLNTDQSPIVHPDVWSFYQAIGYDHRKKKYL